jgi:hypothetical protein
MKRAASKPKVIKRKPPEIRGLAITPNTLEFSILLSGAY